MKLLSKARIKKLVASGHIYKTRKGEWRSLDMGDNQLFKQKKTRRLK